MSALLNVKNLRVEIPLERGLLTPVRGIDLTLEPGETLCIVGESGCGKSLTSLALMGLLPRTARRYASCLDFAGTDLQALSEREWARLRGSRISMIFQEPMTALNPAYQIGDQLTEGVIRSQGMSRSEAGRRAVELLERVGITAAASRMKQYPHQLSGGLRQRVMIAMALMSGPDLIVADEPTTALDVTIQAKILHLLKDLQREFGMAMIFITHDMGVVARIADRVAVMYAGAIVEAGPAHAIFETPLHPYTKGLLSCVPVPGKTARGARLGAIEGVVPSLVAGIAGCGFRGRCPFARDACMVEPGLEGRDRATTHAVRCIYPTEELAGMEWRSQ
jgi:peptide/nickel transport system ATP-binding protein